MSSEFAIMDANLISSPDGELHIGRVELTLTFRGQSNAIDSEMLQPPISIAVYFWGHSHPIRPDKETNIIESTPILQGA